MFCILPKPVFLSDFLRGIPPFTHVSDIWQGVQTEALAEEPGASGAFLVGQVGTNGPTALDVYSLKMFKEV
jgi:hypothetical protein